MQQLAGLAATVLRMLLELYGALPAVQLACGIACDHSCTAMPRQGLGIKFVCKEQTQMHRIIAMAIRCVNQSSRKIHSRPASLLAVLLTVAHIRIAGTAEASGYYSDAAGRIREHDRRNHRIVLDTFLVCFRGPTAAFGIERRLLEADAEAPYM